MYLIQIEAQSDWGAFFGHFHPVVVHLPIGILVIAFVLEAVRWKTKTTAFNSTIPVILFWGFVTAIISCLFGWLLSASGDYNEETLFWHQWLGIGVAAVAGIAWLLKKRTTAKPSKLSKIYTGLVLLMMALLTFTGHLGGNMTHGEDYLTANTPQPFRKWLGIAPKAGKEPRKPITNIAEATVYKDLVEPALELKCWNCHNAGKKKGGLRMDTEELLMKGGKDGLVVKPKDAAGSELIKRLLLPKDDEKRMPPKGKPGLNEKEIALVKWWINNGASFTAKVKDVPQTADVDAYFKQFSSGSTAGNGGDDSIKTTPLSPVFGHKTAAATAADVELLKKENLIVTPVSQAQPFLEVSAINAGNFGDDKVKLLTKLSPQLVWLKLPNTKITDAGFKEIGACKNLLKLNVENTSLSNSSIATIKGFQNLEYLNIIATKIDDKGLLELGGIKTLKNVYCWQSGVTEKGVEAFKKLNPAVKIEFVAAQ